MARKKLNYREGDWFAVPLEKGGYVLGLAARIDKKGGVLGYFFRPKYAAIPGPGDIGKRHYEDAILIENTGDVGLLEGSWPIVKAAENWDRALWPMPIFRQIDEDRNRVYKVIRDENTLAEVERVRSTPEEVEGYPLNGSTGHWGTEIMLNDILKDDIAVPPVDPGTGKIIERAPIEDDSTDDNGDQERHCVKVHWRLSDDPVEADEEMERLMELDEEMAEKFQSDDLEYDGIERG